MKPADDPYRALDVAKRGGALAPARDARRRREVVVRPPAVDPIVNQPALDPTHAVPVSTRGSRCK